MKKLLLLVLMISALATLQAQPSFTVSDKDEAEGIKKTILGVVIEEKDEKVVRKLEKTPDELKDYIESIAEFNAFIKDAVLREWDFSKEVKFLSKTEADKIIDEKNASYSLLSIVEVSNYKVGDFYGTGAGPFNTARDRAYHFSSGGRSVALAIYSPLKPRDRIVSSYLPAIGVSKGSVTFMICNLENQLRDCLDKDIRKFGALKDDIALRRPRLKDKTLLIFDPLISKPLQKVIDKKELGKFYEMKYEVVSYEKADELIASKAKDYAYIWVIPAGAVNGSKVLFNYFIIDAEDARPLYVTGTAVVGSNGDFHHFHLNQVNKKTND